MTLINEKTISTNYKLLLLENENLIKTINDMKNPYQIGYIDRRKILKIDNDLINKIFNGIIIAMRGPSLNK